jgi:hypothetical protein
MTISKENGIDRMIEAESSTYVLTADSNWFEKPTHGGSGMQSNSGAASAFQGAVGMIGEGGQQANEKRFVSGLACVEPEMVYEVDFTLEAIGSSSVPTQTEMAKAIEDYCDANGCRDGQQIIEMGVRRFLLSVQFTEDRYGNHVSDVQVSPWKLKER